MEVLFKLGVAGMTHATPSSRKDWSFMRVLIPLFLFGLILESLFLFVPVSGGRLSLMILADVAMVVGLLWLVARESTSL